MKGEPGNVYRPDWVPTYTLYPARSESLFAFHKSVALPMADEGGGGVDDEGGGGGAGAGAGGDEGGGLVTVGAGGCSKLVIAGF